MHMHIRCVDEIDFQALVSTEKVHSTAADSDLKTDEKVLDGCSAGCAWRRLNTKHLPAASG